MVTGNDARKVIQSVGRPKKRLSKYVAEDMNLLGIEERISQHPQLWRAFITSWTQQGMRKCML